MAKRRRRQSHPAVQAVEMAWAVPHVVAHRLARLSLAAAVPSTRDRDEFLLMGHEKAEAITESWSAVAVEMHRAWLGMWSSPAFWAMPGGSARRGKRSVASHYQRSALAMMAAATAPMHRRAVANARRLSRVPLR